MHAKPKRHWLQFSLRGLLLLMVVITVPLGWLTNEGRQQRIAVAALEQMGCHISFGGVRNSSASEWWGNLLGVSASKNAVLLKCGPKTTDAGLVHLQRLKQIQFLELSGRQITDAGLVNLEGLTQLQVLYLWGPKITDAGLVHLQGLTQLLDLRLSGTQITDAGLAHLEGLAQLQSLWISGSSVTDAGLIHLKPLTRLQNLHLRRTQITDAGCQELQKVFPNLQVLRAK